jgi:hypothetical protein
MLGGDLMLMQFIKCPLNKYTFSVRPIREWVEEECEGKTLNLFAGKTKLDVDEVRVDKDITMNADYYVDAYDFVIDCCRDDVKFNTIILDPPYSYRKSMEMYNNNKVSSFKKLKDLLPSILNDGGKIITFGYHSISMGHGRGFILEKIVVLSHGGAIHDTIISVERRLL